MEPQDLYDHLQAIARSNHPINMFTIPVSVTDPAATIKGNGKIAPTAIIDKLVSEGRITEYTLMPVDMLDEDGTEIGEVWYALEMINNEGEAQLL